MTLYDYVLVGCGLQNGLLALALKARQPRARLAIVEASDRLGGNHTWSFHVADLPTVAAKIIEPLVVASWPAYEIRFPGFSRTLPSPYSTITSDRFDAVLRTAAHECAWDLRTGVRVVETTADFVVLASGERLHGRCVIDSRGPMGEQSGCGYQKFLGLEVEAASPWPDSLPVVIDATVPQENGFHFVYTLPLTPTRVLVEDTYFSDTHELSAMESRRRIEAYLGQRIVGWRVVREESGVLPMPWRPVPPHPRFGPLLGGYAGGWFHPATGYSFPAAVRLALAVADVPPQAAKDAAAALARRLAPRQRFARFLNRLLFRLVPPDARWQIFARLYRTLPASVMARFYALEFTVADAVRILVGRPPRIAPFRVLRLSRSRPWLSLGMK